MTPDDGAMSGGAICVFAKLPEPGVTKTRLARDIGEEAAAKLARGFLVDTWHKASELAGSCRARVLLVLDGPADALPLFPESQIVAQGSGDLGERLERAISDELERAPWAIAIGTDSPSLPPRLIARACERLASGARAVLGPCDDGGFYLLGLRDCPRGLLADLPWSTRDTCAATARRLESRGFDVEQLDPWYDVDEAADLERLRAELASGTASAPETQRALRAVNPELSVIVPVLNEQARIGQRLSELAPLAESGHAEIIVVDGGSGDDTRAIAESFSFARVLRAPCGRAAQMNAGARMARGDALLFLHADVALPADALEWVRRTLADRATVAGAFRTWTLPDDGRPGSAPWLHLADIRSRYARLPYGDQALFVRRAVFFEVGGFPDQPLMEDLELGLRLRKRGKIRVVPARVRVSGRRFLAHPLRDTLLVNVFPLLYRVGVDVRSLARLYHNVR